MANVLLRNRRRESAAVNVPPHRWALRLWARQFRRLARPLVVSRHMRRFCQPLTVSGRENLDQVDGPAIIVANHTSHFDTLIVLSTLPDTIYDRTAVAAAADRFYTERIKGAWYSLRYNAFPITRGGGSGALAYSEELIENGWSLLIFPEGTRSRTGELLPFHPGPAILALRQGVPVVPISIQGAANILPPKTRRSRPASVEVCVGEPLVFEAGTSVRNAVGRMEETMRSLAGRAAERSPEGLLRAPAHP